MTKRAVAILGVMGTLFLIATFGQKPQRTEQLAVFDGDGKRVGVVSGGGYFTDGFLPLVPFRIDGVPFMLYVHRDGFELGVVGWESSDCSGPPFLTDLADGSFYSPSSMPLVGVGLPGNTVYVGSGTPSRTSMHSWSQGANQRSSSHTACVKSFPFTEGAVPASPLIDMNTLYKPPFTVR